MIKSLSGSTVTLACTSKATMDDAVLALPEVHRALHQPSVPPTPLFEGVSSRRLRVLFAVLMGSDACLGGVPNL